MEGQYPAVLDDSEFGGWKGIYRGARVEVNSAQLAAILRQDFFDGEPAWRFFLQPLLVLATALMLWLLVRTWLDARYERNWWKQPVPLWRAAGQKMLASGAGLKRNFKAQSAQLALPVPATERVIVAQKIARPEVKPASISAPVEPTGDPVQKVRPTAPVTTQPKPQQTFWDESEGID